MKNLYKILVVALVATFAIGCRSNGAKVSGCFEGFSDKMVYLEEITTSGEKLVDSVALDKKGNYRFVIKSEVETPTLYHILCNNSRIPLFVSQGEHIVLNAEGNQPMDYTVSGSKESELLHKFNKEYMALRADINTLSQQYGEASKAQQNELKKQYVSLYNTLKRNQIAFIVENKATLASIYALYQRLPGERYLSNENSDILYYRSVLEAVEPIYPTSPFVRRLKKDVERMEASIALLQSVEVCSYPELKGSDMFGKEQSLSSLAGNVILVDFWSAEMGNNNILNAELKELYKRYEAKGFRVYQVSADTSKAIWITAVQEQALPWVSVCDFGGANSPMLRAYNVKKLPSNYLIDRNGNIVAKDLYGEALKRELAKIFK